ncbi:MAG: hypothetical protein V7K89_22380 [Nostoc sp.]|uniref:hypothetical protein n=1 Tax=Nostoc sp. TaxID=1180 RepID=UPI002FFC983C
MASLLGENYSSQVACGKTVAICGVVASCTDSENIILEQRDVAVKNAIATAVNAAASFE